MKYSIDSIPQKNKSELNKKKNVATIIHKNNGTNDKLYRKVAFLVYTEIFNFRPQSLKAASKPKLHRGLGTRLPSSQ